MSIPETNPFPDSETDAQLQQELCSLFVVDTQNYLQRYGQIAQQLEAASWKPDIQELYRCVHTIKGGAVTVAAEAILQVSTALEDLLADLRYLDQAPPLADGHLNQALLEAGELLTGSLELDNLEATQPISQRIQTLHAEIRERYLSQWNEQKQLHQEFAEQGFDLVVLELEIALERSPDNGPVTPALVHTAQQVLVQLRQIGQELQFAAGWTTLLNQAETLLGRSENAVWKSNWLLLFQALKTCAKQGGNPVPFEFIEPETSSLKTGDLETGDLEADILEADIALSNPNALGGDSAALAEVASVAEPDLFSSGIFSDASSFPDPPAWTELADVSANLTDVGLFLDELESLEALGEGTIAEFNPSSALEAFPETLPETLPEELPDLSEITAFLDTPGQADSEQRLLDQNSPAPTAEREDALHQSSVSELLESDRSLSPPEWDPIDDLGINDLSINDLGTSADALPDLSLVQPELTLLSELSDAPVAAEPTAAAYLAPTHPPTMAGFGDATFTRRTAPDSSVNSVQIPVPLEKLDRSSQYLVETLLSLRTTQGFYQTLQTQIMQLVALAQEGVQYVTHLRQIQDDYALLNDLRGEFQAESQGPTPERYRQGYTVINRLLEASLRLSEIGAETGKTAQHITENLRNVDSSVLKLQTTVEESRLVPFQNLTFRARAILRDLITRYGKPARLIAQGEKTELDINTARNLEPALLHLIRNAYDHGLERADDRTVQGKPAQGTITLSLQRRGNTFLLEFSDDGSGIDAARIQARAESLGLPLTQTQTPAELLAVLCQPGFTSETQVSEISGRGVGMDVVAAQTAHLGGRLSLQTAPGVGTTFRLQFPVPRLLVPCMLLQAGEFTFAIPVDDIRTTTLLDTLNATPLKDSAQSYSWVVENESGTIPALDLLEYWQPRFAGRILADTAVCVYIQPPESKQGIWLLADELLEQSELIITPVPAPLIAPDGLIGVSLQANGMLVPVLEARTLADRLLTDSIAPSPPLPAAPFAPEPWEIDRSRQTILIVDDAALMRRRVESSLNTYGYITHTCADGREAWNWLQQHPHPRLVITDIEMPNMDGFTLVDRCRQTGITVPILVISSRLSEEWFDEARRLGASDYLTKGFSTNELLEKVNALLNA